MGAREDREHRPRMPTAMIRFQQKTEILVVGPWMPLATGQHLATRDGGHPGDLLMGMARVHGWTSLPRLEAAHAAKAAGTPLAGDGEGGWDAGTVHGGGGHGAPAGGDGIWADRGL